MLIVRLPVDLPTAKDPLQRRNTPPAEQLGAVIPAAQMLIQAVSRRSCCGNADGPTTWAFDRVQAALASVQLM